jgi:hypothetical protein
MKKYLFILSLFFMLMPDVWAHEGGDHPRLSPAEFRAKQKDFITRDAGLTDDEAAKFFPIYYELQDKKKVINDKLWQLVHQGDDDNLTDSQYAKILQQISDGHIAIDRLDKSYLSRFRKVIPYKKILKVHRSEMRFSRFLIRGMRNGGNAPH